MTVDIDQLLATLTEMISIYGLKTLAGIAIFIVGRLLAKWSVRMLRKALRRAAADEALVKFLSSITNILLQALVILVALSTMGVQTASFIAVLGAAGLAVGLALQGTLSNFASGVMIILFKPFKLDDYVEAGGTAGMIEEVGIFNTTIRTPDNKQIIVPNSNIIGSNIVNYSAKDTRRIDMVFGIGYDNDLLKAKDVLLRILKNEPLVLDDPEPLVAVSAHADSSINFNVRPWVNTSDYWPVYYKIHEVVKLEFDKEGISIPFPQRDVHLYNVEK